MALGQINSNSSNSIGSPRWSIATLRQFTLAALFTALSHTASAQHPAGPLNTKLDFNGNLVPDVVERQRYNGALAPGGQRGIQLNIWQVTAGVWELTAPLYHGQPPFMDVEHTANLWVTPFAYTTTLSANDPISGTPYTDSSGKFILKHTFPMGINSDGDSIPDPFDDDLDNDGILNNLDSDTDGDGLPNASIDTDDDGDGILDVSDSSPLWALENKASWRWQNPNYNPATATNYNSQSMGYFDGLSAVTEGFYRPDVNGNITLSGQIDLALGAHGEVVLDGITYPFVVWANGSWTITVPSPAPGEYTITAGASTAPEHELDFQPTVPVSPSNPGNVGVITILGPNSDGKHTDLGVSNLLTSSLDAPNWIRAYWVTLQPAALAGTPDGGVVTFAQYRPSATVTLGQMPTAPLTGELFAQFGVEFLDGSGNVLSTEYVGTPTSLGVHTFGPGNDSHTFEGVIPSGNLSYLQWVISPERIRSIRPVVRYTTSAGSDQDFKNVVGDDTGWFTVNIPSGPVTQEKIARTLSVEASIF